MAQALVNFRLDEDLKKEMEQVCKDMGITMTTAFTMFAIKVTREKRIPFEISVAGNKQDAQNRRFLAYLKRCGWNNQAAVPIEEIYKALGISEEEWENL